MMKLTNQSISAAIVMGMFFSTARASFAEGPADQEYHLLNEIKCNGIGSVAHVSVSNDGKRLYVVRQNEIGVIDPADGKVVGTISNAPSVNAFALNQQLHVGYASNGRDNSISMFNLVSFRRISKAKAGQEPGAILLEPGRQEVFAFNRGSHSASVYEADDVDFVMNIELGGRPGSAAADPQLGRVYCAIEDKDEVIAIDSKTNKVVNHWPIQPGTGPAGMAIDPEHHLLFIGCNDKLLVAMNSTNGAVIATAPIGQGAGTICFDPRTQLIFSANAEGTVTILHEETPDKLTVAQTLQTQRGARAMAVDLRTHKIYVAANGSGPEVSAAAPTSGKQDALGTCKILVYGPGKESRP